ncbi:MAG: SHOCT domain-containing protein [Ruminococcus sp.]|nr:SHOCT domain-containing protein [Ruminococcus sp.]
MKRLEQHISSNCHLELTDKGVYGNQKTVFSNKELSLPIDKVDNVMISESVLDKLRGGKTFAVRSASGLVRFPWVRNANEFVTATLAKIEEFKKTVKLDAPALAQPAAAAPSSDVDKIKELKELLDSGLISPEEFEEKRRELLSRI